MSIYTDMLELAFRTYHDVKVNVDPTVKELEAGDFTRSALALDIWGKKLSEELDRLRKKYGQI